MSSLVSDWTAAEAAGIVFLPAAGQRVSTVEFVGESGIYWSSSTANANNSVFDVNFDGNDVSPNTDGFRYYGYSVRLITEVK